jgi:hypothetical protein
MSGAGVRLGEGQAQQSTPMYDFEYCLVDSEAVGAWPRLQVVATRNQVRSWARLSHGKLHFRDSPYEKVDMQSVRKVKFYLCLIMHMIMKM